jgi:hypothetical protein
MRRLLLVLALAGTAIACTKTTTAGSYGPFTIGEDKHVALLKLEALRVGYVEPVPYEAVQINNPTASSMRKLEDSEGVLVWFEHDPFPLRIEFDGDALVRTWPRMEIEQHSPPDSRRVQGAMSELQRRIEGVPSRQKVFEVICDFASDHETTVGNFVVGEQELRVGAQPLWTDEYRGLLLDNDAWRFEGLQDQVLYDPFYSTVTLYFRKDRLERIEHWAFPFELP